MYQGHATHVPNLLVRIIHVDQIKTIIPQPLLTWTNRAEQRE